MERSGLCIKLEFGWFIYFCKLRASHAFLQLQIMHKHLQSINHKSSNEYFHV